MTARKTHPDRLKLKKRAAQIRRRLHNEAQAERDRGQLT